MESKNFAEFNLSPEVRLAVEEIGYTQATAVQSQTIPLILEGKDVIGHSRTGSGKTAAFGLPAVDMVSSEIPSKQVQVLILCPTRELAMQATDEMRKFAKNKSWVKITPVYGGAAIDRQIISLRTGAQIVVGTPGRIMDHMRRKTIKLDQTRMVILDEADEMLNMGFREDIETILSEVPTNRQTVLFSATMPKSILEITDKYQRDPIMVKIEDNDDSIKQIEQTFFNIPRGRKNDALSRLIDFYDPKISIIFCNTKRMVDELTEDLVRRGYNAQGLHGDMRQMQRSRVMDGFRSGTFGILIATDVAARGIDINNVDIVFNYDLPIETEYYIHRIGRTGRAGKDGRAFTLICGTAQRVQLEDIAAMNGCKIKAGRLPEISDIRSRQIDESKERIVQYITANDSSKYQSVIDELAGDDTDALKQLAASLFAMYIQQNNTAERVYADFSASAERDIESSSSKLRRRDSRSDFSRGGRDNRDGSKREFKVPHARENKSYDDSDMDTITISIGKKDGVTPGQILGAVAGESGLPGRIMGAIKIFPDFSTIAIPREHKRHIVDAMHDATVRGKKIKLS